MDHRCAGNNVATKTRKWTKKDVEYQLHVSRVNAQTIYCLNHGKDPKKYCSSESMILPHMTTRRQKYGLQTAVIQKMGLFLPAAPLALPDAGNAKLFPHPGTSDLRCCRMCLDSIKAMPDAAKGAKKSAKNSLGKLKTQCQRCKQAVCIAHSVRI